ncbi:hypothetical protein EDD37DRAFT_507979 [Exophiala viscosa]|uniref:uncharacterized protein n=1 Tax=Exophiala viscosa TaxID=2486360 RepID=UPI0021979A41|nr:hypothetical protein EDD37DRAFT_507979 [Exophiala viscosa]
METQELRMLDRAQYRSISSDWENIIEPPVRKSSPQPDHSNLYAEPASRKVVIQKRWNGLSWVEWLSHLASIAYTVAVLTLCGLQVYFADITKPAINTDLNAFQFVAALHAIIVGTSLTAMAVWHLRYELCASEGLPIGFLDYPFQLSSISALFKPRFWHATFDISNNARRYMFAAGILVAMVLQALSGPSSAILIVPQLDWWTVDDTFSGLNGFTYINASHEAIWPTRIVDKNYSCALSNPPLIERCPYASINEIAKWSLEYLVQFSSPNITTMTTTLVGRYIAGSPFNTTGSIKGGPNITTIPGYSAASAPGTHIARTLGDIWTFAQRNGQGTHIGDRYGRPKFTLSGEYDRPMMRPIVQTECGPAVNINDLDTFEATYPTDQLRVKPGENYTREIRQEVNATFHRQHVRSKMFVNFHNLSTAAGRPTLGALVTMDFFNAHINLANVSDGETALGLMPCTILAHWIPSNMSIDPKLNNVAILDNPLPVVDVVDVPSLFERATTLDIDMAFANAVNAPTSSPNSHTVIETEILPMALNFTNGQPQFDGSWGDLWPYAVATVLSLQFSDALARSNDDFLTFLLCEGCANQTESPGYSAVKNLAGLNGGPAEIIPESSQTSWIEEKKNRTDLHTVVNWKLERYGYGWAMKRPTEWLAATVLRLHALLVIVHVVVVTRGKWRCYAWDDLLSLLALANMSPEIESMRDLSTGDAPARALGQPVVIEEKPEKNVFELTSLEGSTIRSRRPTPRKKYGWSRLSMEE